MAWLRTDTVGARALPQSKKKTKEKKKKKKKEIDGHGVTNWATPSKSG